MVIYIDLIFLFNFFIDGFILLATAWTLKNRIVWWRLFASACIGASYVVFMLFPALSFLFTLIVKCIFSVFMIMTAFGFGSLQRFLRNIGVFYLINFAAAGAIIGLHFFLQSSGEVMNGIWFARSGGMVHLKIGFWFIVAVMMLAIWLYRTTFRSAKQREQSANYYAKVQIHIDQFESSCTGLIDTGNQLYDPLTRTPVMIIEASQWSDVLPQSWMKRIQHQEVDQIVSAIGTDPFIWQDRLRLIPYRGINRDTQFMLAIKPDKVVITHNETKVESHKVLIGLDGGKLCSDGSYQAIIHPTLVNSEAG